MSDEFDGVEWDEKKSTRNEAERGFGFDVAADVFAGDYVEAESSSRNSGEQRYVAIGFADDRIFAVIWTPR